MPYLSFFSRFAHKQPERVQLEIAHPHDSIVSNDYYVMIPRILTFAQCWHIHKGGQGVIAGFYGIITSRVPVNQKIQPTYDEIAVKSVSKCLARHERLLGSRIRT